MTFAHIYVYICIKLMWKYINVLIDRLSIASYYFYCFPHITMQLDKCYNSSKSLENLILSKHGIIEERKNIGLKMDQKSLDAAAVCRNRWKRHIQAVLSTNQHGSPFSLWGVLWSSCLVVCAALQLKTWNTLQSLRLLQCWTYLLCVFFLLEDKWCQFAHSHTY